MIHPSTIEEIRNRMNIVEVVNDFVTLKRSGSSYKALSPFTNEKTPSFYVVPSKGIFKDFSSGKGGDAITFVKEIDGLSYVEALRYLANKYGIEIKEGKSSDEEWKREAMLAQNKRESLYIVLGFANQYFRDTLHHSEEGKSIGLSYFRERGFAEETIKKFELGYSKEAWDGLLNAAIKKGYQKEILEEAGLLISKNDKFYDRFRGRAMFPIHNVSGKTIAFAGRHLSNNHSGRFPAGSAKYINSPETELYHKSNVLYGLFQAKNAIRKEDECFIVEGYTDVISMHQAGFENVVASSGTALTESQVKLIRRYSKNITLLFDGDNAGTKASLRGLDILIEEIEGLLTSEERLNLNAVLLPEGEDPDSFVRKYSFLDCQEIIEEKRVSWVAFKSQILLKDSNGDPAKLAAAAKEIAKSLSKIKIAVDRELFQKECSIILGISESSLIAEINKNLIQERKNKKSLDSELAEINQTSVQTQPFDSLDIAKIIELQERESVRVLVNYGKNKIQNRALEDEYLIDYFLNEAHEIQFTNQTYRKIVNKFKEKLSEGEIIDGEYFLGYEDEEVRRTVIDLSTEKYELSDNWLEKYQIHVPRETEFLRDVTYTNVLRLKFRIVQQLIQEETKKLKETANEGEIDELLDDINELKSVSVEIAKVLGNVLVG